MKIYADTFPVKPHQCLFSDGNYDHMCGHNRYDCKLSNGEMCVYDKSYRGKHKCCPYISKVTLQDEADYNNTQQDHGRWLLQKDAWFNDHWVCSVCGESQSTYGKLPAECPECESIMDLEDVSK